MGSHGATVLREFRREVVVSRRQAPYAGSELERYGLAVPLSEDLDAKQRAMDEIRGSPFVLDALTAEFGSAQEWIEDCSREVDLPINFCGSQLILRLYRAVAPPSRQTRPFMAAVYGAAAAYDFAFLALAHADDEADLTQVRHGSPARHVTHPHTRAVDGINLLLGGITHMQRVLARWPATEDEAGGATMRHPLSFEIMEELLHALRSASFPIILDRAGLGHARGEPRLLSGLTPIRVDAGSLQRVEAFARHRAHTYFMRAATLAALLAEYASIDTPLLRALEEVFALWGSLGAATDDLQDIYLDFASGTHSLCAVMAHLCVAEDRQLRPLFRQCLPDSTLNDQRQRLKSLFGQGPGCDPIELGRLLSDIELKRALSEYLEQRATLFAAAMYKAVRRFGFRPELMIEMVAVVCRDPQFVVPDVFLSALGTIEDEKILEVMYNQVGKFMANYAMSRLWPSHP